MHVKVGAGIIDHANLPCGLLLLCWTESARKPRGMAIQHHCAALRFVYVQAEFWVLPSKKA